MLEKISYAGAQSSSFAQAAKDLHALAEVEVTAKRIERWTKRVGDQRVAELERAAADYQALPLPVRQQSPTDQIPQVACVQMDGGRIQIRDRRQASDDHESKGYWRETLVGCCLSMTSNEHAADPCPTIPQTFVDAARMSQLGREIKGFSSVEDPDDEASEGVPEDRAGRPKVLLRSVGGHAE